MQIKPRGYSKDHGTRVNKPLFQRSLYMSQIIQGFNLQRASPNTTLPSPTPKWPPNVCQFKKATTQSHVKMTMLLYICKFNTIEPFVFRFYPQTTPPVYKVEDIKTPIALWSGGQDFFADPKDMAVLCSQIKNLIYQSHIPEWQHLDFIWGLDATERMYIHIIDIMKKYPLTPATEVQKSY